MVEVTSAFGYDIYELTEEECDEGFYEYPCFCAVCEGEDFEGAGHEECSVGTLNEMLDWCREYRRD